MKVTLFIDFGIIENTGGYKRNLEVSKRLAKRDDVVVLPSLRNLKIFLNQHEGISSKIKELRDVGVYGEVIDAIGEGMELERITDIYRKVSRESTIASIYSNSSEEIIFAHSIVENKPLCLQLQLQPFYKDYGTLFKIKFRGPLPRALKAFSEAVKDSEYQRTRWLHVIKERMLNFVISVSETPVKLSGLDEMIPYRVTVPSNAFDSYITRLRSEEKEDYAVYFTRLIPEKGIFEIPRIWKRVNQKRDYRIYVFGNFSSEYDRDVFEKSVRRLNVNVEYLGYKEGTELYRYISKGKVTVYPSHYDSFSLVILESLAAGTPVTTYDIEATREIYSGVKDVLRVQEDNIGDIADITLKVLNKEWFIDNNTDKFLELRSSWETVANADLEAIKKFASTL
ncbi:hypothetical protein HS7_12340 [Sulfolobales archaeon HS-7]|nr:hypothetical protein HS7_12340 [Sulfolobales archaeon HS-7]